MDVNLRSIEGRPYRLLSSGHEIGTIDRRYLASEAHPGAVYLHDGATYRVDRVDARGTAVYLVPTDDGVVTRPISERHVDVKTRMREPRVAGSLRIELCELHVATRIVAYQEYTEATGRPRATRSRSHPYALTLTRWEFGCSAKGSMSHQFTDSST